jgi:hypothetical protein
VHAEDSWPRHGDVGGISPFEALLGNVQSAEHEFRAVSRFADRCELVEYGGECSWSAAENGGRHTRALLRS